MKEKVRFENVELNSSFEWNGKSFKKVSEYYGLVQSPKMEYLFSRTDLVWVETSESYETPGSSLYSTKPGYYKYSTSSSCNQDRCN